MGMMKAAKLAPDAILLPATFDAYRHYSRLFKEAVASIAPDIEDRGIDEIFVDLTEVAGETRELAARIKQAVLDATGLTCSIGVTPNKLLSKICSDLEKPNGLTVLGFDDIPRASGRSCARSMASAPRPPPSWPRSASRPSASWRSGCRPAAGLFRRALRGLAGARRARHR
jgi:nucleotidyltransferase/DNA polymerase involved in DNA repair